MKMKTTFLLFIASTMISIGSYCQSVQTHPRLWIRSQDIAGLKAKAVSGNPYFNELQDFVNELKIEMDAGRIPNQYDGTYADYSEYPTETTAMMFAFMSLITEGSESADYAARAKMLVMHAINLANLGPANDQPFRDQGYSVFDRSRWYFFGIPLAVDWIYPKFNAAEKATIRNVFLRWCDENTHATTTTDNHPVPIGVRQNASLFENDDEDARVRRRVRYASNNYYLAHLRNIYFMAASMDNADDAGGTLHNYIDDVTGSWLYVTEEFLKHEGRGGLSAEGFLYGPSAFGRLAQTLLAIYTSGEADALNPMRGERSTFNMSFWDEIIPANLHSITPVSYSDHPWSGAGEYYLPFNYGDIQKFRVDDYIDLMGPMGWYDKMTGNNASRLNMAQWYQTHIPVGGADDLERRVSHNGGDFEHSLFYFLLFDPNDAPTDPRPAIGTTWYAQGIGRILSRTDWTENASAFSFKCGFNSIDHQFADGMSFSFYRKGAFLTSPLSGYGYDMAVSKNQNSLALENNNPGAGPDSPQTIHYQNGSQWWSVAEADGSIVEWSDTDRYLTVTGDATGLYTYVNPWVSPTGNDITHASRTAVWIKSGQVILYDRAASATADRYKQFWLGLPSTPTILGKSAIVAAPNDQTLYVTNLLPVGAVLTAQPYGTYAEAAINDQMHARLMVEDASNPKDIRFLHVLQGLDNGQDPLLSTALTSDDGSFQGCSVGDLVVMFKKNLAASFTTITFTAPANINSYLITGLTPLTNYAITVQPQLDGTNRVTVASGIGIFADLGGVITQGDITPAGNVITKTDKEHEDNVSLSPNPTSGVIRIKATAPILNVKIIDMEGRLVKDVRGSGVHEQLVDINAGKGLHVVQVKTATGFFTKKIIKQ
jgi:hypothetical protein